MGAFRELPVVVSIGSTSEESVSRVTVACVYEWSAKKIKRSAGTATFDSKGGVLQGSVQADALGVFPDQVVTTIAVDYAPKSGFVGYVFVLPSSSVTPSNSYMAHYDVPFPNPAEVKIVLDTVMNAADVLTLSWALLANGVAVKGETVTIRQGAASAPNPASIVAKFDVHAHMVPQLRLRCTAANQMADRPLEPFDQTFDVTAVQSIKLTKTDSSAAGVNTFKFVATTA